MINTEISNILFQMLDGKKTTEVLKSLEKVLAFLIATHVPEEKQKEVLIMFIRNVSDMVKWSNQNWKKDEKDG